MPQFITKTFDRPDPALVAALGEIATGILSDCLNRFGALDAGIQALVPGSRIAGPAFTVQSMEANNWETHHALALAEPGDVIVCAAGGSTRNAVWGQIVNQGAVNAKVAGAIIDGCVRDSADLAKMGLPLFCRGRVSAGAHKGWPGNLNAPVAVGGVAILPGDIVVGDDDGVVVVPKAHAEAVLTEARKKIAKEAETFNRLAQGETTLAINAMPPLP
jgi:regulator of RNase E activity RraA